VFPFHLLRNGNCKENSPSKNSSAIIFKLFSDKPLFCFPS
jgi:hypothetical protein